MQNTLKILSVEDISTDTELAQRELTQSGIVCEVQRVDDKPGFIQALEEYCPDIILCDFSLPQFDGLTALKIAQHTHPDIPFIFVSGTIGEEIAINALKLGASDYILKTNLPRLPSAVHRALLEAKERYARKQAEIALEKERNLLSAIFDNTGSLEIMLDTQGRILRFNRASEQCTGYQASEVAMRTTWELFFTPAEAIQEKTRFEEWEASPTLLPAHYQSKWLTRSGQRRDILWLTTALSNSNNEIINFISSGIDITEWRQAEDKIHHLNNFDELTDLPNRALLWDRLSQAIARKEREGGLIALLLIDIKSITHLRQILGQKQSDKIIVEIAQRLLAWKDTEETVARFGDSSFAIILEVPDHNYVTQVVQHMIDTLDQPYQLADQQEIYLDSNIGIAIYPTDANEPETLFQATQVALHRAIERNHERYQFHTPDLNVQASVRLQLATQLRQALLRNELLLYYQPQIDIRSGKIIGVEALLRWQHPEKGMVAPSQFIALAEETGLIIPIGEWVLRTACSQNKAWQNMGLPPRIMAVNLSAKQFAQKNLEAIMRRILSETALDPQYLELELTESVSMGSPENSAAIMRTLKSMGIRLSLDDFGTGYSSLNYLKRFPIDVLKIDQSFIRDITTDPDDLAIAKAIIALANSLQLDVLAEGVETKEQLDLIAAHGCDLVQGYYFSRPLPVDECTEFLKQEWQFPKEKIVLPLFNSGISNSF